MTLDSEYLRYLRRRRGMDQDLYDWSNLFERPAIAWPGGGGVAIWPVISLEWFPIVPRDRPFRAPGHMQTAYPDFRHYTARDYGTRVGFYRLLEAFEKIGARITIAANGAIAERYPELIEAIVTGGHEIVAHSTDMNGTIDNSLPVDEERALIADTLAMFERAAGIRPIGWLSIARSQSFATPRLLAEAGLHYMCDWCHDDMPVRFRTEGGPIVNVPLNHELSDRQILTSQQQSVDSYVEQMQDAYRLLSGEAQSYGGRMLPLHLTPYIMGLPYRIDAFERLLDWFRMQPDHWFGTGRDLATAA